MDIKHEFVVTRTPPPPPLIPFNRPPTPIPSSSSRATIQLPPILNPFLVRASPPSPPSPKITLRFKKQYECDPNSSPNLIKKPQNHSRHTAKTTRATAKSSAQKNSPSSFVLLETNPCCKSNCCVKCCAVMRHNLFHGKNHDIQMECALQTPSSSYTESVSTQDHANSMYAGCKKSTEIGVGLNGSLMQRARWIRSFMISNKKGCIRSVDRDAIVKLIDDFMFALKNK